MSGRAERERERERESEAEELRCGGKGVR